MAASGAVAVSVAPAGAVTAGASTGVVPVAASSALRTVLTGPPVPCRVRGVYRAAAYLQAGDGTLLALSGPDAHRLPCAVRMATPLPTLPGLLAVGQPVTVGGGGVQLPDARLQVTRWFDPTPVLARPATTALRDATALLATTVRTALATGVRGPAEPALRAGAAALAAALQTGDAAAAGAAADTLLGCGPGSTPSGDDMLAGALVTLRLLAAVHPAAARVWDAVGAPLARHVRSRAERRTTPLSAALLRHAAAGEPAGEVADVLRAVCGRGELAGALRRLLAVGHTSGIDLADGLRLGLSGILTRAEVGSP